MGLFGELKHMAEGTGHSQMQATQRDCLRCQSPMEYRGAHAIRTGGLSRGAGLVTDMLLGGRDEEFLDTAMERSTALHVFVCPQCAEVSLVNDSRHGF
ncbi:MAG: hypothetical protein OWQ59_11580 [Alicyclobacillaceae bacterium]|jgi:hypothetical protein|uniref:hypothetical protein n=1 Tax=Alicyclobacillus sp. SP_1 TaxID=2942475 RepID=UPI00215771F3|nr:hypothetical protein [Alicyclobacillus sp. SP_1]MCY0889081.1 hypothetical protein [Alicyclobacillaceae bacterium]